LLRGLPSALPSVLTEPAVHQTCALILEKGLAALGGCAKRDNIDETDLFLEFVA
jgi:hypothetical protein